VELAKPTSMAMACVTMTASQDVLIQWHVTMTRVPLLTMAVVISRPVTDVQILKRVTTQQQQLSTINPAHILCLLTIVTIPASQTLTAMVIAMNSRYMVAQMKGLAITRRVLPNLMKAVCMLMNVEYVEERVL
jgi:hypothetical protein